MYRRPDLTEYQLDVLKLLAQGKMRRQVSVALGRTEHSVDQACKEIISALGAANMTNAVAIAYECGILGRKRQHAPGTLYGIKWHNYYLVPLCEACRAYDRTYRKARRRMADHGEQSPPARD